MQISGNLFYVYEPTSSCHLLSWYCASSCRCVDGVSFHKKFNLIITVNHTWTHDKGHYTAHVKLPNSSSWQFCNETVVLRLSVEKITNTFSYIHICKVF